MGKKFFRLISNEVRQRAIDWIWGAPDGHVVTVSEPTRSLDQNAAQWPILEAFAAQMDWPVNGVMTKLDSTDWKDILTAAFQQEKRVAEGLNGGNVMLGAKTSEFSKAQFSEWLEFLHFVAADRGVKL